MNPLYEPLPKKVEVGGILYPIKTDFRAVLKLIGEVKQAEEPGSRLFLILRLYKNEIPPDIQGAVQAVTDFIAGIRSAEKEKEREGSGKQTFSYEKDAPYIVSDFQNYYGIDLLACKYLHWQKFQMLLEGLPDDSGTKPASATVRSMPERSGTNRNASGSRRSSGQYPWKTSGMRNRSVTCSRLRCGETDKKMGGRKWQTEH